MDSFLLLRRLVAAIVFKGQTVSDYWWSRRTIFLTENTHTHIQDIIIDSSIILCVCNINGILRQYLRRRNLSDCLFTLLVERSQPIALGMKMKESPRAEKPPHLRGIITRRHAICHIRYPTTMF